MAITTQFLTGFEHGFIGTAASAGGGLMGTVTVPASWSASTSSPRNGSYCAHFVAPATTITNIAFTVPGNPTKVVLRFGLKLSARPTTSTSELLCLRSSAASDHFQITANSGGRLGISFSGAGSGAGGPTIDTTSWHLVEIQIDILGKTVDWKVDGVAYPRVNGAGTPVDIATLLLGSRAALGSPLTADYDDLIFGTWTDPATDWYGDGKVLAQLPGFDGFHQTPTAFSVGDAGAAYTGSQSIWGNVDDPPGTLGWTATRNTIDNMAMRVANTTAYLEIDPAVTTEAGQANAVRALLSYSSPATQANLAACDVRNSAGAITELWGLTGGVGKDYSETANQFKGAIVTRPAAGWTAAEVNAIRFRFGGCTSVDISPVPTVQAMMLEVDWPVAAVPRKSLVFPGGGHNDSRRHFLSRR